MGVRPWTQQGGSVAGPQNRCDQMRHGLWKSERVDARGSSRSLMRRLIAHWPSQCETRRLQELHPFWDMKRQNKRRRKCLSGEFFSQGSWHPLHRFGFWDGAMSPCYVCTLATIWWIIQCCNPIAKQQETHCMWYKIRCRQEKEKFWVCVCVGAV